MSDAPSAAHRPENYWTIFTAYENGKSRRYGHLFAVNGGAFALVGFLAARHSDEGTSAWLFNVWAIVALPVLLGWFAWLMCNDIDSFGRGMRKEAGYPEDDRLDEGIYRAEGRRLLDHVRIILMSGWIIGAFIGIIDTLARLI